uniref:DNA topoisomerase 2 n=1 Tax=Syphacia muris TaxID=451379 RepID=A0A0N5ANS0_9BILA
MNSGDDIQSDDSPKKAKTSSKKTTKSNQNAQKKQCNDSQVVKNEEGGTSEDPLEVFTNIDKQSKRLSIEKIYQKKTQLEHILLRPDTYIGSMERTDKAPMWVYDADSEQIVRREISYVPGLYKIFDEILVNAADNKQRDPKMSLIRISINREKNEVSVFNNGKGIPVVHHKIENMFVPELIFGTLLTSSNYNDDERKVTGGRNGYGAKLCNIFSTEFTVETSSKEYGKSFKQTWKNNMTKDKDPLIAKAMGEDFTRITFKPDLAKFKMNELDDDIVGLMSRRAYDVAGSTKGVKVQGFKQYVEQYAKRNLNSNGEPYKVVYEQSNNRWEVALTISDKGFQQVSFVNSIATTKGGRHVDYIADQITAKLIETIKKKIGKSGISIKPFQVRNHMWVFVNALIENPTFDSQTKEALTLQPKSFGSKCELSEKFINAIMKCGIVEAVMAWVRFKQQESMDKKCSSKKTSKLKGVPKLEDANDAGTKNSSLCTLILTEGDSAKSLAVSGLGVVGRDRYGVFPLRGKMLNVREGSHKQIMENAEINALLKIIGLQYRLKYDKDEDMKTLRYGKVMVMADQDQDGSHIKGLVINFIHFNWPNLIKRNFVEEFITPIVKATKGKEEFAFFSLPEYVEWRNNTENWKSYRIKYYKGLGTSTSKEAKEYFTDMTRHRICFHYGGEADDECIDMAFSKKKIEDRKVWLTKWMAEKKDRREQGLTEEYLYDKSTKAVSFKDFVNKELVLFSNADNERSIPSLVDGLKPGQRKVLFTCFKRADKREVKVAQLAGAVGEMSAYHHGEASLMSTIVNLAQDFVGSNNINLLLPIGQFGTRLQGGKDCASPRYIFTQLNPVARALFPPVDENVLRFLFEENQRIEPEWYCPIIPTVLVNGAEGIGTAWSTKVPNYNPREVVTNIRRMIDGQELHPLVPWFKNFRGTIEKLDDQRFICSGEISLLGEDNLEITELPIRTWTQNYKESVLETYLEGTEKHPALISDFKEYHTDTTVKFVVKMNQQKLREVTMEGLHKVFKLQTVINTSSMVLFDALGCLRKFATVEEIFKEFFETRKKKYIERKAFQEGLLKAQSDKLSNQARFILAKIKGEIQIENRRKVTIVEQLVKMGFDPDPVKVWREYIKKKEAELTGEVDIDGEEDIEASSSSSSPLKKDVEKKLQDYDYLVGMAILKLSEEEKNKLLKESELKLDELKSLQAMTWGQMWNQDLDHFLCELDKQEAKEKADLNIHIQIAAKKLSAASGSGRKKTAGVLAKEVLPNPNGTRVEPKFDYMKEKYETKNNETKVRKAKEPKALKTEDDLVQFNNILKFYFLYVSLFSYTSTLMDFYDILPPKKKRATKKKNEWETDSDEESSGDDMDKYCIENDEDDYLDESNEIKVKKTTSEDRKRKTAGSSQLSTDKIEVNEGELEQDAKSKNLKSSKEKASKNSKKKKDTGGKNEANETKVMERKLSTRKRGPANYCFSDSTDSSDFEADTKKRKSKRGSKNDDDDDEFQPEF